MATKKGNDSFANIAALNITESAANTYTTAKFQFPFSIMDKMGLIIQRIEYDFTGMTGVLAAASDAICAGIAAGSNIVDIDNATDPMLVDNYRIRMGVSGAAPNAWLLHLPYIKDFTTLQGGGLLVAPNPLYGWIKGISAGAAGAVSIRMFYTYIELATDEYWQLVESRRIISST